MTLDDWAQRRGIPGDVLQAYGCWVGDDSDYDGWLAIPYPNRTGTWGTKWRNPEDDKPKYIWEGNGSHLYNPTLVPPGAYHVVFTEGEFDAMILCHLGFNAIGIPGVGQGASFKKAWTHLFSKSRIYILFDNDEAGQTGAVKLASNFAGVGLEAQVVNLPDRWGDVNEMWRESPTALDAHLDYIIPERSTP